MKKKFIFLLGIFIVLFLFFTVETISLDKKTASISENKILESKFDVSISKAQAEKKIAPWFKEKIKDKEKEKVNVRIDFSKDSYKEVKEAIKELEGEIIYKSKYFDFVEAEIPADAIVELAKENRVKWVEGILPKVIHNDGARASVGVDTVQTSPYNLDGSGVRLAIWDVGHATHSDFSGRISYGDSASTAHHSTHVAGTMAGDGSLSASKDGDPLQWRGMSTAATIISYDWNQAVDEMFYESTQGTSVSQNSWTYGAYVPGPPPVEYCDVLGGYTIGITPNLDTIVRDDDLTIVFSAGNDRNDDYCEIQQRQGYDSISAPATGKNVIAVGALNSNDDSMTAFSSWGPTDDGRLKPDVVAPGCQVGGDGGIKSTIPTDDYGVECGTSMSAPVVSGVIGLMIESYRLGHTSPDPLPSTIKAILIHTADDLDDTTPHYNTGPDYASGYGKINAVSAVDLIEDDETENLITEQVINYTNGYDIYEISVPASQSELKVSLVWSDLKCTSDCSTKALVNDLDLIVTSPSDTDYYPWVLDPENPSNPATTGVDSINNIEQVYVSSPDEGTWQIKVDGVSISSGTHQNYSLISDFGLSLAEEYEPPAPPKVCFVSWYVGEPHTTYEQPFIDLLESLGYAVEYNSVDCNYGDEHIADETADFTGYEFWAHSYLYGDDFSNAKTHYVDTLGNNELILGWDVTFLADFGYATSNTQAVASGTTQIYVRKVNSVLPETDYLVDDVPSIFKSSTDCEYNPYCELIMNKDYLITEIEDYANAGNSFNDGSIVEGVYENLESHGRMGFFGIGPQALINGITTSADSEDNGEEILTYLTEWLEAEEDFISITLTGYPIDFSNLNPGEQGAGAGNPYTIRVESETTVDVDLYQKGDAFEKGSDTMDISNMEWNLDGGGTKTSGSSTYQKIYDNVGAGDYPIYYWLSIPGGKPAGSYQADIYIKAVKVGETP